MKMKNSFLTLIVILLIISTNHKGISSIGSFKSNPGLKTANQVRSAKNFDLAKFHDTDYLPILELSEEYLISEGIKSRTQVFDDKTMLYERNSSLLMSDFKDHFFLKESTYCFNDRYDSGNIFELTLVDGGNAKIKIKNSNGNVIRTGTGTWTGSSDGPGGNAAAITLRLTSGILRFTAITNSTSVYMLIDSKDNQWMQCYPDIDEKDNENISSFSDRNYLGGNYRDVTNPVTGQTWMDRNLGATQAATSSTDAASYGDLYQWGRGSDGHQLRTSPTTSTLSSTDQPEHGSFILAPNSPADWRSSQNDDLWQEVNGGNNPCPSGYRLPTYSELDAERLSWSSNDAAGAFASPLKLPMTGFRASNYGSLVGVGYSGRYWSSTGSGTGSIGINIGSGGANMLIFDRASGVSVRCLKD
jgi:uncharacterized protein (TIGR02145 family)